MRLIDADELYKKFIDGESDTEQERSANQLARYLIRHSGSVDAVPVVRCRECKHYRETRTKRYGNLICRCTRMGKHDMDYPVKPDDFCSYGER